ncbi:hypothetical protein QTO34_016825 [Cnephaeus nilssonii]|uniref:Uncharacterized protein n=1 Tax=Cnephaeus nilssonii TaxID=3371016 RepID=A0AA40I3W7_CNENI|nr:hypothetical protein QTO34_016825 [Eptesicus nilssonii]
MRQFELRFEKLSGLTTDGAPATVGLQRRWLWLNNGMPTAVLCINVVKSRNFEQFKELLNDLDSEYIDLIHHCEVRWEHADEFYDLLDEVKQFLEMRANLSGNSMKASGCVI